VKIDTSAPTFYLKKNIQHFFTIENYLYVFCFFSPFSVTAMR